MASGRETRTALAPLRVRAPPDARLIMVLVRVVHELDGAEHVDVFNDVNSLLVWMNRLRDRLGPEIQELRRLLP